jgi:predicted nucleic acid-binding Zn ribbon protein
MINQLLGGAYMFCTKCGKQIPNGAKTCSSCYPPNKKSKVKTVVLIVASVLGCLVMIAFSVFALSFCSAVAQIVAETTPEPTPTPISVDDFKQSCVEMDYDEFARRPEQNENKNIVFTGTVVQVMGETRLDMRVAVGQYYDDIVYVRYTLPDGADRILQDDKITVYGISRGSETYLTALAGTITIPSVQAKYIDIQP